MFAGVLLGYREFIHAWINVSWQRWSGWSTDRHQGLLMAALADGAEGGTRTPTSYLTRPSNVRVYQFRHFGTLGQDIYYLLFDGSGDGVRTVDVGTAAGAAGDACGVAVGVATGA